MRVFARLFVCLIAISAVGCGDLKSLVSKAAKDVAPAATPNAPIVPSPTPSEPPASVIAGVYDVRGTNPGGRGNYTGTAMISQQAGDTYRIDWSVGTSYTGTGLKQGNQLNVEWGTAASPVGVVKYNIEPDGRMTGVWYTHKDPNSLGSEILIPRR